MCGAGEAEGGGEGERERERVAAVEWVTWGSAPSEKVRPALLIASAESGEKGSVGSSVGSPGAA